MPLLFALGRRLIVSSAALLTSLILIDREPLVQARLLPAILSVVTLSMPGASAVGAGVNPSLTLGRATGTVSSSVVSASIPL